MTTRRKKPVRPQSSDTAEVLPLQRGSSQGSPEMFGHRFERPELLIWALTHRSLAYETNSEELQHPSADNEQLEFVGDAVLGLVVAESLLRRFPESREGELTRLRASLVSRRHLGAVAARMNLGALLRLGRGEEQSGGRQKPALLANALEAVIAALYLDGGLKVARKFIEARIIEPMLPELHQALLSGHTFSGAIGDHKSALQEHLQATGAGQPEYVLTAQSGPDHQKRFRVQVRISDGNGGTRALAESEGTTKKQAQQEAARMAFERLQLERREAAETRR
ncbi:MAG TPA: ribonuclease III [Edaphobacter sp.]